MHTVSSYRGGNRPTDTNTPTHKQTNTQTGPITIHYAAKLSAQCNDAASVASAEVCALQSVSLVCYEMTCCLLVVLVSVQLVTKTKKMFVGGLSASTSIDDVRSYFEQFGKVRHTR